MPTLEFRVGLAAHDFASALGAPEVLITRARRDSRSPTVASRFLLRLDAISGGLPRDRVLERMTQRARRPGPAPAGGSTGAGAAGRTAARPHIGDLGRSPQGRSFRFLRERYPEASRARPGRCRPYGPVEGRGGPQGLRGMAHARRVRPRQASRRARSACSPAKPSIRCFARFGRRVCSKRSTGSQSSSEPTSRRAAGR